MRSYGYDTSGNTCKTELKIRHSSLLATGALRELHRQPNLHKEDIAFSTKKAIENIQTKQRRAGPTVQNTQIPDKDKDKV